MLAQLTRRLTPAEPATSHQGLLALPSGPSAWLLAAALAFAPLTSLRVPGFAHLSFCDVLFVVAVAAGIVERVACRDFVYQRSTFIAAMIYSVCAMGFTASYVINYKNPSIIYWSPEFSYNINYLSFVFNTALFPLAVFAVRVRSLAEFRFILLAWTCGALYGGLFVIAYTHGFISHYDYYWVKFGRASGLTTQPNVLGFNIVLALPGLLLFFCEVRGWLVKGLIVLGVVLVWITIDATGSRTAVGGFVFMFAIFLVMRSQDRIRGAMIGGGILLAVGISRKLLALLFEGTLRHGSALERLLGGATHSNAQRDVLNSMSFHVWTENPIFGAGYNYLRQAHNLYLQILTVTGVVGFLCFIVALGMPLFFLLINRTERNARNEVAALWAALVTLLAMAWIQPGLTDLNTSIVFGLTLYLALNPYFNRRQALLP